jgi:hypothetical protein
MPRPKKTEERPKRNVGFAQLMADLFTSKQFNQWIARCGLPTKDSRRLCEAFKDMKG